MKSQLFRVEFEPLGLDETYGLLWLGVADLIDHQIQQKTKLLSQNFEFLNQVLETSVDCIKVIDLDGNLLYMNNGGQLAMEIDDVTQVKRSSWLSFWSGCYLDIAQTAFYNAWAGKSGRFEGFCQTAKGTPKWWDVLVSPMLDLEGNVSQILSVSRDITERKRVEQALQVRNQELDQFTYAVSHDLKSPLRGIANLTQWLEEDLDQTLPEENQLQLRLIRQRVLRMNSLLNDLLELHKVGRQCYRKGPIEVQQLLNEVIDLLAPPKTFTVQIIGDFPKLVTQKVLLSQVFSNLIDNAIKHHDRDTGKIQITASSQGQFYCFTIADDGQGIANEYQNKIFDIFQTLADGYSTESTGIGLALVKKIVMEVGGRVWVENLVPHGCQFCFTWPRSQ
jgi:PAS domain S-box-containing protein